MCALELGTKSNGSCQADDGGLALLLTGLSNGIMNSFEVAVEILSLEKTEARDDILPVTICDVQDLPAVRLESLVDILSESNSSVSVDRDIYVFFRLD